MIIYSDKEVYVILIRFNHLYFLTDNVHGMVFFCKLKNVYLGKEISKLNVLHTSCNVYQYLVVRIFLRECKDGFSLW